MKVRIGFLSLLVLLAFDGRAESAPPPTAPQKPLQISLGGEPLELVSGSLNATAGGPLGHSVLSAAVEKTPLIFRGAQGTGNRRITALVRLHTGESAAASATISVAKKDEKDPGLRVVLSAARGGDAVTCQVTLSGKPLHDAKELAEKLDWTPEVHNSFTFYPRAYPFKDIRPGWPEDYRARIEHDMAQLPDVPDKWLSVRIELATTEIHVWLDDRLVTQKYETDLPIDGTSSISLAGGAQLAAFSSSPWKSISSRFRPISIDAYNNAKAFIGNAAVKPESLPAAGEDGLAVIDDVPFRVAAMNAEGNDHIDIGRSLFRQANFEGYQETMGPMWVGSSHRDPARIQLRVPNGPYDALYLLAAAEEKPNTVPIVTAMFYRPSAGFAENFEAKVPLASAQSTDAKSISVTLANGKTANLWLVKIPLDPGRLSLFADSDILEFELTKRVALYRQYPDPIVYGWHQAGLPSSVHVYGATLGTTPVAMKVMPDNFGHVWTAPQTPSYTISFTCDAAVDQRPILTVSTRSYDGSETTEQKRDVRVATGETEKVKVSVPVKLNGYHDITFTAEVAGKTWTEKRSFVRLAPDNRAAKWTPGQGALFGYWSYHGGHYTPKAEHHVALMTAAGARTSIGVPNADLEPIKQHWGGVSAGAWEVAPQPWAMDEPIDPQKYAAYQKTVVEAFHKARDKMLPEHRPDHVYFFPEPHISQRLTEGNLPEYWHGEPLKYTDEEQKRLRMFMVTAKCAAEAIRKEFPDLKILVPWGDALFVPPMLRAGFPKELIDGSGIDTPGFERLPEMQLHQGSIHRLYELRKEYEKAGIPKPQLQYTEGIFVPTEPGSVSYREQMDIYHRATLLSMAYGVDRFYAGWFCFDSGNYYGAEHYGGCGIQRRIPYCDPKPAYAAYATMTDRLDRANFDGWLKTGSLSTYCLRFKGPRGNVYALWTLRGKRPVTLTLVNDGEVPVTDSMNNTKTLKSENKHVTFGTDPSIVYVSASSEVTGAEAGEPDHSDAAPPEGAKPLADLGDGSWTFTGKPDLVYQNSSFAVVRYPGNFEGKVVADPAKGKVLRSTLGKQEQVHELMPWYGVLAPKKPIALPGAPSHLGLWVKGNSDWGRVVYVLRDAKGERWTSVGTRDQYNCDDPHCWSAFNFDGWRYLRFESPGHAGYDNFRKAGTTWWGANDGDGIVDLPLTLEQIIVEQRSHVLYVNDVQPAASDSVDLGKLYVEYESPADATPEAIRISKLRMPPVPKTMNLPNPIAQMQQTGVLDPPTIDKVVPPLEHDDGTTMLVHFTPVPMAKKHFVWGGTYEDGRGAVNLMPAGAKPGVLLRGLRPGPTFYVWMTYQDEKGQMSKPSPPVNIVLVDRFKEK